MSFKEIGYSNHFPNVSIFRPRLDGPPLSGGKALRKTLMHKYEEHPPPLKAHNERKGIQFYLPSRDAFKCYVTSENI